MAKSTAIKTTVSQTEVFKWIISLGIPMAIWFFTPFDTVLRAYLAISLGGILFWAFQVIPEPITGLLIPILFCIVGIATPEIAFTPWSMILPWLVLSGIIMGEVMFKTGLAKRIAYKLLLVTGCSGKGLLIGCFLLGVFLPLLVPAGAWTKLLILGPIGMAICKAWGLEKKSKEATGIMAMILFAALSACHLYMTGDESMVFISSLFTQVTDGAQTVDFFRWLKLMWLPGFGWLAISILTPYFMFVRPNRERLHDISETIRQEYQAMGKLSINEIKALVIVLLILLNFMLETKTGLNAAHIMVVLVSLFFAPGIRLMDADRLGKMNIWIIFFITGALAVGICAGPSGFSALAEEKLLPILTGVGSFGRVLLSYTFGVIINFLMTPLGAQSAFLIMIGDMLHGAGINPVSAMMSFQMALDMYLFPYEVAPVLFFFGLGYMDTKNTIKIFGMRMVLSFVLMIFIAGYWNLVGLF